MKMNMKIYYLFLFFVFILKERCVDNEEINKTQENYLDHRDFEKDMDELDLSGLEYDIENVEEIAQKESYNYVTQIYVYIRIDEEYKKYINHLELMRLGQKFMTILQNSMLNVQLKKTGNGIFTCFYDNKAITEDLATYFLIQKEVDFIEVGFDKRYPEGRQAPITDSDMRVSIKNEEL
ncbi:hypothetical protein PGSY75_0309100 [Plasmodium gaboni]|uniref:Uncharacterized protein n=1 Tax=Plasmodium gaboni TaxID=647221 RepID=A0A151LVL1_9APIC|nr:hypothetical protein PGSY75_0309100 [Plasmodium gaboni]KYO03207.1 hypothetical protein PGSY75_0309100 [Plasmodium gaboni]SOV10812.1 conserved Plasmodium protein, unknown function [Plasmodium gaboni]